MWRSPERKNNFSKTLKQTTARRGTESKSMVSQISSLLCKTNTIREQSIWVFFLPEVVEHEGPTAPFHQMCLHAVQRYIIITAYLMTLRLSLLLNQVFSFHLFLPLKNAFRGRHICELLKTMVLFRSDLLLNGKLFFRSAYLYIKSHRWDCSYWKQAGSHLFLLHIFCP